MEEHWMYAQLFSIFKHTQIPWELL